MFSNLLRLTILIVFISLMFWLKSINNDVLINISNYTIETTIFNIILILLVLAIPLYILCKLVRILVQKVNNRLFISYIISLLKNFKDEEEKDILLDILKNNSYPKDIRIIKDIKELLVKQKYSKVITVAQNSKLSSALQYIAIRYTVLAYEAQKDINNLIITLKQGILIKGKNFWFFKKLLDNSLESNDESNINYLNTISPKIAFVNKADEKKYNCILKYKLAQYYISKNEENNAQKLILNTLRQYSDFTPMYSLLIIINENVKEKIDVNKYLEQAWLSTQNYNTIDLWFKYYKESNYERLISTLNNLFKKVQNTDMNMLLLAMLNIKSKKIIEAYEAINKVSDKSTEKYFIQLELMKREKDYSSVHDITETLYSKYLNTAWWKDYIK